MAAPPTLSAATNNDDYEAFTSVTKLSGQTRSPSWVLLPGLDGTGRLFAPLCSALSADAPPTVVRYDTERSFEDYVETSLSALPSQECVLIAESFSGPIALAVAARYPARVSRLVLCATFARSPYRTLLAAAKLVPQFAFSPNPTQRHVLRHFCFNSDCTDSLLGETLSVLRSVPATTMKSRLVCLADIDVTSLLSKVHTPTLYLLASADRVVGRRLSREVISALPNVTVRELNGPHLLLQTRARECAAAIESFAMSVGRIPP